MANNEDYLDSLLRAASSQDNPDSAINKVREINRREAEEAAMAEAKLAEEALSQAEDLPIAQEEPVIEEVVVDVAEAPAKKSFFGSIVKAVAKAVKAIAKAISRVFGR